MARVVRTSAGIDRSVLHEGRSMLQVQHLSLQFVGHDVDKDDLAGHALGEDAEGAGHADLANTHNGHLVARAADGLGHLHHKVILERHG